MTIWGILLIVLGGIILIIAAYFIFVFWSLRMYDNEEGE